MRRSLPLIALLLAVTVAQHSEAQEPPRKKMTPAEARLADQHKPAVKLVAVAAPVKPIETPKAAETPKKAVETSTPAISNDPIKESPAGTALIGELQKQIQDLREDVQQLAAALKQSETARHQIEQTSTALEARAAAAQNAFQQNNDTVAKLDKNVADLKQNPAKMEPSLKDGDKRLAAAEGTLSRFRFLGDFRFRYETFAQSYDGCTGCDARNRPRLRFRFGAESRLNEDFTSGFVLASGVFTDPISTNETLGSLFQRKTIGIDRAWITYQARGRKWLQLTAGKFTNPITHTPLTTDNDVNPEGFSEKFSFDFKNTTLRNVALTATQYTLSEVASGKDSYALGGQFSTRLQLGKFSVLPSASLVSWTRADVLARSAAAKTLTGSIFTNATTPDGKGYQSGFLLADYIVETSVPTPWERFPIRTVFDYVKNMRAANKRDTGYWAEFTLGQTKKRNDVQFLYNYYALEQDAVLAAFTESDSRAGTNVRQHRFGFLWQLQNNVTAGYTLWLGKTLDSTLQNSAITPGVKPGEREPYLKRMQMDVNYKF